MEEQSLSPTPSPEARQWAMFCHFAAFAGLLIPFGNLLGPAKELQARYLPQIEQKAATLDAGQIMSLVRGQ